MKGKTEKPKNPTLQSVAGDLTRFAGSIKASLAQLRFDLSAADATSLRAFEGFDKRLAALEHPVKVAVKPETKPAEEVRGPGWTCDCGWTNMDIRERCRNCHGKRPAPKPGWRCGCGRQYPDFVMNCENCGRDKPPVEPGPKDGEWWQQGDKMPVQIPEIDEHGIIDFPNGDFWHWTNLNEGCGWHRVPDRPEPARGWRIVGHRPCKVGERYFGHGGWQWYTAEIASSGPSDRDWIAEKIVEEKPKTSYRVVKVEKRIRKGCEIGIAGCSVVSHSIDGIVDSQVIVGVLPEGRCVAGFVYPEAFTTQGDIHLSARKHNDGYVPVVLIERKDGGK